MFFFELIRLSLWVMLHVHTNISFWKYQLPIGSEVGKLSFTGSFQLLGIKKLYFSSQTINGYVILQLNYQLLPSSLFILFIYLFFLIKRTILIEFQKLARKLQYFGLEEGTPPPILIIQLSKFCQHMSCLVSLSPYKPHLRRLNYLKTKSGDLYNPPKACTLTPSVLQS